ncbi:uncharacterized protein LACBIDRAFT_330611 [Laccaria bicolor S238N-H82]|uniref:Predicted protein n=1 Tax=Laccaria bicolor (strain S238N-H82 / ATCC MYA-4686) TaxID=486041 RepID=B0DLW6_LACBS|nr:uncharacterized protein LACBIDRAFT_330611 [Laccaria bicolor S238N-H82]EDR04467.1 predicted protein [Laccaria bicolor S238N-H82]|eukprot:XP_001884986.1 predicted protein [Laccaria bicolor S238N-H82]
MAMEGWQLQVKNEKGDGIGKRGFEKVEAHASQLRRGKVVPKRDENSRRSVSIADRSYQKNRGQLYVCLSERVIIIASSSPRPSLALFAPYTLNSISTNAILCLTPLLCNLGYPNILELTIKMTYFVLTNITPPSTPIAIRPPFLTINQNLSYTTPQRPLASQKPRKIYRNGYESKPKTPSYKLNNPGHPRQKAFAFSNFQRLSARCWNEHSGSNIKCTFLHSGANGKAELEEIARGGEKHVIYTCVEMLETPGIAQVFSSKPSRVYGADNARDGRGDEDAMITTRSERQNKAYITAKKLAKTKANS